MLNFFCDAVRITCVAGVAGVEVGASKPLHLPNAFGPAHAYTHTHTHTHTGDVSYRGQWSADPKYDCSCMKGCTCNGVKACFCANANQKPVGPGKQYSAKPPTISVNSGKVKDCACACGAQTG